MQIVIEVESAFADACLAPWQSHSLEPCFWNLTSSAFLLIFFAIYSLILYVKLSVRRADDADERPRRTKRGVEGVLKSLEYESRHPTPEELQEYPPYIHCSPSVRQIRWIAGSILIASVIVQLLATLNKFHFRTDPWSLISSAMLLLAWICVVGIYTGELRGFGERRSLVPAFWIVALLFDSVTLFNHFTHPKPFTFAVFVFRFLAEAVLVSSLAANRADGSRSRSTGN